MKEILYVLLDKYAAHEMVFLSQAINDGEMGLTTEPWGQRTCYVADPEGNLIEISSFEEQQ